MQNTINPAAVTACSSICHAIYRPSETGWAGCRCEARKSAYYYIYKTGRLSGSDAEIYTMKPYKCNYYLAYKTAGDYSCKQLEEMRSLLLVLLVVTISTAAEFSVEEKSTIVSLHNKIRQNVQPPAITMPDLVSV